jgi:hypothetical protein
MRPGDFEIPLASALTVAASNGLTINQPFCYLLALAVFLGFSGATRAMK